MMSLFYTGSFQNVAVQLVSHHVALSLVQLQTRLNQISLIKREVQTTKALQVALKKHILHSLEVFQALLAQNTTLPPVQEALETLHQLQLENRRFSRLMHALHPLEHRVELAHVLDTLFPLSALENKKSRVVLMNAPSLALDWPLESVLTEHLPSLFQSLPTQWIGATRGYLANLAEQLLPAVQAEYQDSDAEWLTLMTAHVLGIRFLGLSYYSEFVVLQLKNQDYAKLATVESVLFEALNYLGISTPQVVRLHQIVEAVLKEVSTDYAPVILQDFKALFSVVETYILEEDSCTERHCRDAVRLLERLKKGLPVCALQNHDTQEVWDKLHALGLTEESTESPEYSALHEQGAIYQLMAQVSETPVGFREMFLAAWVFRLEESAYAMAFLVSDDSLPLGERWTRFCHATDVMQHRFIKSIETAEVHQVLLGQSRRHLRQKVHVSQANRADVASPMSLV
jgi:hypothetical protein